VPLTLSTTPAVTLAEAKEHLRVTVDTDDALITRIALAATQFVEGELQRPMSDFNPVPAVLKAGVLLVLGTFYEHRETHVTGTIASEVGDALTRIVNQFCTREAV
jgi:hypothetical protein